ncbi:MAG: TlpA disulfide reductase family protein [Cyclobacteriaceae bacterium]
MEIAGQPRLNFEGPKSLEHSFLSELAEEIGWFPVSEYLIDEKSVGKYKTEATNHFDSSLVFLENYFTFKSGPFETVARDFLTIRYYHELIYPVSSGKISKEKFLPGYFDPVDFTFFIKAELLGFREFIILVSYYNRYFYSLLSPQVNFYDSAAISAEIQSASLNFEGEVKDHLLLFTSHVWRRTGQGKTKHKQTSYIDILRQLLRTNLIVSNKSIILKRDFDTIDRPLPKEILAQQLKTQNGTYVSLNEVLASNDAVYVDFWASWCGPCLSEMPYENQLISEFKGKQIKFILISIDKDAKEWRKGLAKANVLGTIDDR